MEPPFPDRSAIHWRPISGDVAHAPDEGFSTVSQSTGPEAIIAQCEARSGPGVHLLHHPLADFTLGTSWG